ncbi:MAG: type II toxin-antitoxin system VapC family toxin [Bosea sp. (in: a-proteobacteria)]|jgi:predicted nucleic acid-binding protein
MSIVIDASIAAAWCFEDEATAATDEIAGRVRLAGGCVPNLWRLEIGNVLLGAERRGRLKAGIAAALFEQLGRLPIKTDSETSGRAWSEIAALARLHRLTTYDAAYLELAVRLALPLATLDVALAEAAGKEGVTVLGAAQAK